MADTANENPYLAVVSRKNRNLKKKLQNIHKVEAMLADGKSLNEEQLVLLSTKPSVERALLDVEAIKLQLEEVAKEIQAQEKEKVVLTPPVVETVGTEVATETITVVQVAMSTQCEATSVEQPVVILADSTQPKFDQEFVKNALQAQVRKLLKTLHVCSRYHSITGTNLPPDVDYFGKCLLGMTSIGDFNDALSQSVKNATMFLDPVAGAEHEAIRGMNYVELGGLIDHLATHIDGGAGGDNSMESLLSVLASPIVQPEINFFGTDEIIDDSNNAAAPTTSCSDPAASVEPRKPREKRERKHRPDKKKENVQPAPVANVESATEPDVRETKPPRKPRQDKPKKASPVMGSSNENNNDAETEKISKASKNQASKPGIAQKKEKPHEATVVDRSSNSVATSKPTSWASAVSPTAAAPLVPPTVTRATKPSGPRPVKPASTSGPRGPRPANKNGEKKAVASN